MMKLFRNKRAQNLAEYALLFALVIGAIIGIQTFGKRLLMARIQNVGQHLVRNTDYGAAMGQATLNTAQYEPYYQNSQYDTTKNEKEVKGGNGTQEDLASNSLTVRDRGGFSNVMFNPTATPTIANGMTY
ncbi:MAG: hypothetical protein NT079_04110 [Candidatus Omnitrophica bacterium]|nr:hypothetical protein [Candidatus Omnitrophota bacterium]